MSLQNTSHWINQNEIRQYIQSIKKYPLITKDQELELINKIKCGDQRAKHALITANLRFVIRIAKNYKNQGITFGDLISEGNLGLVKAADKFDYFGTKLKSGQEQVRFLSYAVWWIKQSILETLKVNSRLIRYPANLILDVHKSNKEPLAETTHDYTLQFPVLTSLDATSNEESFTLLDIIKDENNAKPSDRFDSENLNIEISLMRILKVLTVSERYVIIKCFGLDKEDSLTLQQIAIKLQLTKERVRQIKERGLKKLRNSSGQLLVLMS